MGEIAEMMLDGTLDQVTGEYIGDLNEAYFGDPSPGFPVSYDRSDCPICDKQFKSSHAMKDHMRDAHQ